jgi:hypothetical protein
MLVSRLNFLTAHIFFSMHQEFPDALVLHNDDYYSQVHTVSHCPPTLESMELALKKSKGPESASRCFYSRVMSCQKKIVRFLSSAYAPFIFNVYFFLITIPFLLISSTFYVLLFWWWGWPKKVHFLIKFNLKPITAKKGRKER